VSEVAATRADQPKRRARGARTLNRLATAADTLEERRDLLIRLQRAVDELSQIDVIVVDGERAVLAHLADELAEARAALRELAKDSDDAAVLDRFEALVAPRTWTVLEEVAALIDEKRTLAETARADVQRRLGQWAGPSARVTQALQEIQDRRLYVVEPRELTDGRNRMDTLIRQATTGLKENKLLDAWLALDKLEKPITSTNDARRPRVPAGEVPGRLEKLIERVKASSGRLQLTVLRGPLDQDRFEYTLMLLTPMGDRHIGVNVQDSTTIVKADRAYFLREVDAARGDSYRQLRALRSSRDGRPPAEVTAPGTTEVVPRLSSMGSVLYRLLVPDRMKEEMASHPDSPLTVITNDLELPWELMHDGEFLALTRPVARMPVGRFRARRPAAADVRKAKRRVALIASAGPEKELQGAIDEVEQIEEGLRKDWRDVDIETFVTGKKQVATGESFRELLMSGTFDIIHFAGHAIFDQHRQDQSGLLLEDAEVCFAQKIQRLLEGNPVVFLNACDSARLQEDADRPPPDGTYEGDPKEGLASAFVYGGALACIGTLWPVIDTVAADFAVAFYGQVLEGQPLGEATRAARKITEGKHPADPSWASFVLYGDPSFSLATPAHIIPGSLPD
jgi:hypothetical protein